jgi:GTP-sensing pleiotropic transcriptional regulator CodY
MSKQAIKVGNFHYQQQDISDRYDPLIIPSLEQYVQNQLQEKTLYDKEANLFLLKLYQFNPQKSSIEFIKKVLTLALLHGGTTNDFNLALYLIQERIQGDDAIVQLSKLSDLLETCQFDKFWEARKESEDLIQGAVNFDTHVRKFITGILSITYQETEKHILRTALNLKDDKEVDDYIKNNKEFFRDDASTTVRFALNSYNQILPKKAPQNIKFEQVVDIGRK